MKIKEIIELLKKFDQEKDFVVSSDEELNVVYKDFEVANLTDTNQVVIYGLSGSEEEY